MAMMAAEARKIHVNRFAAAESVSKQALSVKPNQGRTRHEVGENREEEQDLRDGPNRRAVLDVVIVETAGEDVLKDNQLRHDEVRCGCGRGEE
jgi:hypothetical protein